MKRLLLCLPVLLSAGCFDFDADYLGCFDAGLCDGEAPELVSSSPSPLEVAVPLAPSFTLVFSEPMDTGATSAALEPSVSLANPLWDEGNTRLTLTPLAELALTTSYVLTVEGQDLAGNALNNAQISFTTRGPLDTTPPTLSGHSPAEGAVDVQTSQKLSLQFSEPMDATSLSMIVDPVYDLGVPTWSVNDTRVDFLAPPTALAAGTLYSIQVSAKDLAQNLLVDDVEFSFETLPPPDSTPPTLVSSTPADTTTGVPLAQTLSFIFSEPMTTSTASSLVTFSPSVPSYTLTWYNEGTLLEVDPTAALAGSTSYTVTLNTSLQDSSGNAFAGGAIQFTTTAAADTSPPSVVSHTPAHNAIGAARTTDIVVTFSEPMDRANTQAAFSVFSPARTGTFTWNAASTQLTFNPDTDFAHNTVVQWQVSTSARDQAGNALPYTTGTFRTVRITSVNLISDAAVDGYLHEPSNIAITDGTTLYSGDSTTNEEYEGYLHFPLGALPASLTTITEATLFVYQASLLNDPYGTLYADSVEFGPSLTIADLDTPTLTRRTCTKGCTPVPLAMTYQVSTVVTNGWKSALVTPAAVDSWEDRGTRGVDAQFRLRFSGLPNGDSGADYAGFYSGDSATSRPYLRVTYEYP